MEKIKKYQTNFLLVLFLFLVGTGVSAQEVTTISGKVIDAHTKEPLPFVNISFVNKNIGTTTDYDGKFSISTQWASNQLMASYIGYQVVVKEVQIGQKQKIQFELESYAIDLGEVVVTAKKKRYRNKNNPAVDLIRNIVKNKNLNRKEHLAYYQYDKYEKIQLDLNNITEKFKNKKIFNKTQFVFNYVDTAKINGKPYLPVFLKETLSEVYFRKGPKDSKEIITGTKMVGFHEYLDNKGIGALIDNMYQDVDIYDANINLLTNVFVSPISKIAPMVYKFHIIDTLDVNGHDCIQLAFQPRNKRDFAFKGNLFVTNDQQLSVVKVDMRVTDDINLNFVDDLQIIQEFEMVNNKAWILTKDEIVIDFIFKKKGTGMYGRKAVFYDNFVFDQPIDDAVFNGVEQKVLDDSASERDDTFWATNRIVDLTEQEMNIYTMVDSVQNLPGFQRTIDLVMLIVAGYWNFGKIDVGAVNTFYSFNEVEGFRLRFGGRTNEKFSKNLRLDGFVVYGFKDERFKYSAKAEWSLNGHGFRGNPRHTLMAMYQRETKFAGMEVQFINEDNFLLSFKRGVADKLLYYDTYNLEHYKDWKNNVSTTLGVQHLTQEAGGTLKFAYDDKVVKAITTTELTAQVRYAPNEKYYEGMNLRTPIYSKYPVFQFKYTQGLKDVWDGEYDYQKLNFSFFKRFYMSQLGYTNFEFEANKILGDGVPFPNLYIHRANQSYSYQLYSYNLMNFLEFVSDESASVFAEHHFNGFFLNKVPVLKRLNWRSVASFKGLYGSVREENNPDITNGLMYFPSDSDNRPTTFTLQEDPYMEASIGVENIFKFFRIDVVKRLTYLDNPNVSEYGVRARFKFDF